MHIPLEIVVALATFAVRKQGESTIVIGLRPRVHDPFGTETALHLQVLLLSPHEGDDITAHEHLHFCVAILEELVLSDPGLVTKQADLQSIQANNVNFGT